MDTHNMDEICDVCGDVGYGEALFTCTTCTIACEHIYCMPVLNLDNNPETWICESCKANTKLVDESIHSETPNVIASVFQQQLHQAPSTLSQVPDMATRRRTSVFEREQRRAARAPDRSGQTNSSEAETTNNLVRDEPPTQRQCVHSPTSLPAPCRSARLDNDPSSSSRGGEIQFPNINPFVYQGPYSSKVDEIEYLNKALSIWQGLGEFPMEGELGCSDPRQSFILGMHDFRRAFTRLTVSFGRIGDELNHLYLNYAPREELTHAQSSLVRANQLLVEAKVKLESYQASSQAEIEELKAQLAEAKSQLCDAKYLVGEFKNTEEFVIMQNNIMECGVNWSVRQASIEHPGIDFGFLQIRFKAECDTSDNDSAALDMNRDYSNERG